ncbi:MAG: hypothetical protein RLZZ628_4092 [Bacteroidota bacterium]|jgi:hypothetical protein
MQIYNKTNKKTSTLTKNVKKYDTQKFVYQCVAIIIVLVER